jgi:sigma-B regulation protein RsbU (phosphoserine phosphatase)
MALGVLETERWGQNTVVLDPGETLLLYTDGVTEAAGPAGTMFGSQRLLQAAEETTRRSAGELAGAIMTALDRFAGSAPQVDDITLVIVGRDARDRQGDA